MHIFMLKKNILVKKFKLVIYDVDDNSVRTKIEIVAGEIQELEVNIEGVNTIGFCS